MMKDNITVQNVIDLLNELHSLDPEAIGQLVTTRAQCNEEIANHPSVIVREHESKNRVKPYTTYSISIIGLLNGLFGLREDGQGPICYIKEGTKVLGFKQTPERQNNEAY